MEKEKPLPLNDCHARKTQTLVNRLHAIIHGITILPLFYYRITSIATHQTTPILPHFLILISELILSFIWVLSQVSKWSPVTRTAYPERLPRPEDLPPVDVFICTADPDKEPTLDVMNTVISGLGLDYPPDKLHVYVSDDAGSSVTFRAIKEAWRFSKVWVPFCRKYEVVDRCPEAYFVRDGIEGDDDGRGVEFLIAKKDIQKAYEDFKNCLAKIVAASSCDVSRDHPPRVEVISDSSTTNGMDWDNEKLPLLVYVAREKRPSHPHHFKAGALNVLLRVSAMISNSPYFLVLDCDMYCNDPASARLAMCFHLDPKLSPKLAFVQFPQKFYNISKTDIYDCQLRFVWEKWEGLDGLIGPILSGTGFYMKREALYANATQKLQNDSDLKKYFGSSNELINSVTKKNKPNHTTFAEDTLQKEIQLLASCTYDNGTKWGKEVGFRYFAVVEDIFTGLNLHCEGWISVYCEPSRPCFLGASPISLGELLVQHTRWNVGLNQIALSRFAPLVYGPLRMPISQSMCYAEVVHYALQFASFYILALVPQLCLLQGIPLYPETSSPFFVVFMFLFASAQLKHVQEVITTGHSIRTWSNEQRMWMIKSLTSYAYATLDALMEKIGLTKAIFSPTSKVVDDEVAKRYEMGIYDFRAPALFMVPLCTLYIINLASFVIAFGRILHAGKANEMLMQAFVPLFGLILHYPLFEGMVLRKDKGRVSSSVFLLSVIVSSIILAFASLASYY